MIAIDDLHKSYRTADGRLSAVLKGLSLQVPERSITAVVGPSGAGKSTLARCISLLERPDSGSIRINGQDLSALSGEALRRERRAIGTVFQSSALLSRRTAWQNVALPLAWLGVVERDIKARVGELLESVGLSHKADAWPSQLSGGQRQRIGIARALALRPSVLLADEATSGLDPQATASVLALLKRLRDEYQLAIVLIRAHGGGCGGGDPRRDDRPVRADRRSAGASRFSAWPAAVAADAGGSGPQRSAAASELPLGCTGGYRLDQPPEPAVGAADRSPWRPRRGD